MLKRDIHYTYLHYLQTKRDRQGYKVTELEKRERERERGKIDRYRQRDTERGRARKEKETDRKES